MAPFYGWGSIVWKLKNHWGNSWLATTKFRRVPGTHFINLEKMKDWVDLEATEWFWTQDSWIGNPAS